MKLRSRALIAVALLCGCDRYPVSLVKTYREDCLGSKAGASSVMAKVDSPALCEALAKGMNGAREHAESKAEDFGVCGPSYYFACR